MLEHPAMSEHGSSYKRIIVSKTKFDSWRPDKWPRLVKTDLILIIIIYNMYHLHSCVAFWPSVNVFNLFTKYYSRPVMYINPSSWLERTERKSSFISLNSSMTTTLPTFFNTLQCLIFISFYTPIISFYIYIWNLHKNMNIYIKSLLTLLFSDGSCEYFDFQDHFDTWNVFNGSRIFFFFSCSGFLVFISTF